MAFKCFICGEYAGEKMKCGTWICKDHIKMLGGMKNWREIRFMTPEQVYFRLGIDEDNALLSKFEPTEKDRLMRDSLKAGQQLAGNKRTVVVRQGGGCLTAIGWFVVVFFVIIPLVVWFFMRMGYIVIK